MFKKTVFFFPILLFCVIACSGGSDDENNFYLSATKEVAPNFTSAVSGSSVKVNHALYIGDALYTTPLGNIYSTLQDYVYPDDEGSIDMHNIYKVLTTSGQLYPDATTVASCVLFNEREIASPYPLGVTDAYNCAANVHTMADNYANAYAIKEATDGTKYSLLPYKWASTPSEQQGYGVLQGHYNATSGDLYLRMTHLTYYPNRSDSFSLRTHLEGNALTHTFALSTISNQPGSQTKWFRFVGKGVAKGTGYFLVKYEDEAGTTAGLGYYCIPASATLTDLEAINTAAPNGYAASDPALANCASYQTDVDNMTQLTTAQTPMALSDFTDSSILLSL